MTLPGRVLSRMPRTKTTPKLTRTTSPASFILADRDHRSPTPWTEKPGTVRCADWRDCDHEPVRDASRSALFFRPIPFRFRSLDAGSTRLAPAVLLLSLRRWTASVHWGRICLDGIDHGARNIGAKVDAAEGAGPGGRASTADYAPPEAWDANDCRLRQPRAPLNPRAAVGISNPNAASRNYFGNTCVTLCNFGSSPAAVGALAVISAIAVMP